MPMHVLHLASSGGEPVLTAEGTRGGPSARADQTLMLLTQMLDEASMNPSELLELAYYAAEPDLRQLIRLVAALDPEQRARVSAYAQAMRSEAAPSDP